MDEIFGKISSFYSSASCIFKAKPIIDYPNHYQQSLICSYFRLREILASNPTQIIQTLHAANGKNLETIVQGIIYMILEDFEKTDSLFERISSLRNQVWDLLHNETIQLIREAFIDLKDQNKLGVVPIFNKLLVYGFASKQLVVMMLKTINIFDWQQDSLTYSLSLVHLFHDFVCQQFLLQQSHRSNVLPLLCHMGFLKMFKIITLFGLIQDEEFENFISSCNNLLTALWNLSNKNCMYFASELSRYIQEVSSNQKYVWIVQEISELAHQNEMELGSQASSSTKLAYIVEALSVIMPLQVQATLLFICHELSQPQSITLQMEWCWKEQIAKGEQISFLLPDIVRWVTVCPYRQEARVNLLNWMVRKAAQHNIVFQLVRQSIFLDWLNEYISVQNLTFSLNFLKILLHTDIKLADNFLHFILKNKQDSSYRLRQVFKQADQMGILKTSQIVDNNFLSNYLKEELNCIILGSLPEMYPNDAQMSAQLSDDDITYKDITLHNSCSQLSQEDTGNYLKIDKEFSQQMEPELKQFIQIPQLITFTKFISKLLQVTKQYKRNNNADIIEVFFKETSKIIYLLFNWEFEDFLAPFQEGLSVIHWLLSTIEKGWRQGTFQIIALKKLIKVSGQLFPTMQATYWRHFLTNFKSSSLYGRQIKDWLIAKEKQKIVLPLLRELMAGQLTQIMMENGRILKLPL